MAKKKRETEIADDLDGTVEGLALDHFEREKAAYEERTGETVKFVPPVPVTRTPVKAVGSGQEAEGSEEAGTDDVPADAGTPNETEGEGTE